MVAHSSTAAFHCLTAGEGGLLILETNAYLSVALGTSGCINPGHDRIQICLCDATFPPKERSLVAGELKLASTNANTCHEPVTPPRHIVQ